MKWTALILTLTALILLTGCEKMMGAGDAGCFSYGIERSSMPDPEALNEEWLRWVVTLDSRMTGTCA